MYKKIDTSGWGRVKRATVMAARPERVRDLHSIFVDPGGRRVCAQGARRSYGDCAINFAGVVVMMERLDRILAFDERTGFIVVEPGVTFEQLLHTFLPRGWVVPVSPGTGFATIGGAVANDVHGKNHEHNGSFGQHVTELDVMTPDGTLHTLSPTQRPEWLKATIGGIGLTGITTRIAFRMMRVPGPCMMVREQRVRDLDAFLSAFESARHATYSVGWIDALANGNARGRGILETGEPVSNRNCESRRSRPSIPFDFPQCALNSLSVAAFNSAYFHRIPGSGRTRLRDYANFLYPLDGIRNWNRIYGRRGFHQFQCVVPFADGPKALSALLAEIVQARAASFLAVLKRLGPGRAGYLSFPMEGYTLAIDFPNGPAIEEMHARLARTVLDNGGRVYLAKDDLLSPQDFAQMYADLPRFRDVLVQMDPTGRMDSDMARRLQIRTGS